ncbi:MAG: topoisomerase [Pseudonocardiales bacterium]|nr:topoisomerase [Pseudonocardiales bacterium]
MGLSLDEIGELHADNRRCAEVAGLVYVMGTEKGLRRKRAGKKFAYYDDKMRSLASAEVKARITELAIPPAWKKVWICPSEDGHILATGEDERGRKQYIYHPTWRAMRDMLNFYRLIQFSAHLGEIRDHVDAQLRRRSYDRDQVMAAMIRIIDICYIRIGNEKYAEENNSFGLSTLTRKHVRVSGSTVSMAFPAKSGKAWQVEIKDKGVARVITVLRAQRTPRLFTVDGHRIRSGDVNDRLLELTGTHLTAKNFRTWGGTLAAFTYLRNELDSQRSAEKIAVEAVDAAATTLGNTRSVARAHYVHPHVLETYTQHTFAEYLERAQPVKGKGLSRDERQLTAFLAELFEKEFSLLRSGRVA